MTEAKPPRFVDDEMIIETVTGEEVYDAKYLAAALLVYVAKGDGRISNEESEQMLVLLKDQFDISSAESLALVTRAMTDIAENPDYESLLNALSSIISEQEKEQFALMMLKVVAANGRKDSDELIKLRAAAEIIEIPPETLHRAYDRYFEETQA